MRNVGRTQDGQKEDIARQPLEGSADCQPWGGVLAGSQGCGFGRGPVILDRGSRNLSRGSRNLKTMGFKFLDPRQ